MGSSLTGFWPLTWTVLVMLFAGTIQGATGFGFGLVVVPLLLSLGCPIEEAVAICVVTSASQRLFSVYKLRKAVDWKTLRPMIVTGLLTIPIGVYLLRGVSTLNPDSAKQIMGACVLIMLAIQWFERVTPREAVHKAWGHLAALFAGLLTGFANIGGPPIVLWILAHHWPNEKTRVTQMAFSVCLVPLQLAVMAFAFGQSAIQAGVQSLLLLPAVILGSLLGLRAGGLLKRNQLRLAVRLLLLAIALNCLLRPMF